MHDFFPKTGSAPFTEKGPLDGTMEKYMSDQKIQTKRNFLTHLIRGNVLECRPLDEPKEDGPKFEVSIEDSEPMIVDGEIKFRQTKKRIKSEIEIKKTGVLLLEVRHRSYVLATGKHGISTTIVAVANN
jgi:hypothetical protein